MTHQDVIDRGVVDDYVAGRLTDADRSAFEDHFFECDACFAMVQADDTMRRAVRAIAASSPEELDDVPARQRASGMLLPWLLAAAAIVAGAVGVWLPRQRTAVLQSQLSQAETRSADLERALADVRARAGAQDAARAVEANVPLAILQTTRGAGVTELNVPADARQFVVWLEDVPPAIKDPFDLAVTTSTGSELLRVRGLRRNQYGAVVATFPADRLVPGQYALTVKATPDSAAVATYRLAITR